MESSSVSKMALSLALMMGSSLASTGLLKNDWQLGWAIVAAVTAHCWTDILTETVMRSLTLVHVGRSH
eukprot:13327519-Ditylum_brightwellii.AAC.1